MSVYVLDEKLKPSDKRYRFIHDFCKNEIVRRRKQAKKQQEQDALQQQDIIPEPVTVNLEDLEEPNLTIEE